MAEIAAASDQQSQGIDQVNKAVEQMNQVTQQTAANAEESASAAEELSSQSQEMQSTVAGFRLTAAQGARLRGGGQRQVAGPKAVKTLPVAQATRRAIPMDDAEDQQAMARF
jgi:methyl-accepting chemotaxis protein